MRHSHDLVPTLPASLCPALCSIIRNRGGGARGGLGSMPLLASVLAC